MNEEIKEILDNLKQHISIVSVEDEDLLLDYITNLQEKVNRYENPNDMTLMFMWCDEKAKDKIKILQEENENNKKAINLFKDDLENMCYQFAKEKSRNEKAIQHIDCLIELNAVVTSKGLHHIKNILGGDKE